MNAKRSAKILAAIAAIAVLGFTVFALRLSSWMPIFVSVAVYVGVLLALWPIRRPLPEPTLPDGIARADYTEAMAKMSEGAERLRAAAARSSPADGVLFSRMADLLETIRAHHLANPGHTARSRSFVRHTLGRIVAAVEDFVELAGRAGPDQQDRLDNVSRQIEAFVPALEKIDQACVANDMLALEVSVEVLNDQLDRDR